MTLGLLDRYLLGRTLRPTFIVMGSALLAFLTERVLRSSYLLAQTAGGTTLLLKLILNLAPHYLGLTLPGGFFIALFIVLSRLSKDSEVDAMLACGVSLGRVAAPLVGIGMVLMAASLLLYGFLQPLSWYGYHVVLNAAENAGWSGELQARAVLSPSADLILTADDADRTGRRLQHVFIRRIAPDGREDVVTARTGAIRRDRGDGSVTLELEHGKQLITTPGGGQYRGAFESLVVNLPMAPGAKMFRGRGADVAELTLVELVKESFGLEATVFPREGLLAELYARIARAIALPLMPLLAVPLGLASKRAGTAPAMAFAAVLLFLFESMLIFGDSLADAGRISAEAAVGLPIGAFAGVCIWTFVVSRKRPGENPVSWVTDHIAELIAAAAGAWRRLGRPAVWTIEP